MRSDGDEAWRTKGATGFGARLLLEVASTFSREPVNERRALHESIAGAAVLGTLAVVWGIAAQSRVLLFDGAFILLGIVLSALSLMASRAAADVPSARFPFGKAAVTPLAIAVQGVALLGTLIYAAVDAVAVITAGGADVEPGTVLAYGLITMTCSYAVARWLTHRAPDSELVAAEVAQWRAGALLSLVFAVGGGLALALADVGDVVRYVDPVLVLVACLVLLPIPLRLLRAAGLELLEAEPPAEVRAGAGGGRDVRAGGVRARRAVRPLHQAGQPPLRRGRLRRPGGCVGRDRRGPRPPRAHRPAGTARVRPVGQRRAHRATRRWPGDTHSTAHEARGRSR